MTVHLHTLPGSNHDRVTSNTLFGWEGAPQNGNYLKMYPWMAELARHLDADGQISVQGLLASLKLLSDQNMAPDGDIIETCEEQIAAFKRYINSLSLRARRELEIKMANFDM